MNKLLSLLVLCLLAQIGFSQNIIDTHFSHYKGHDDFTTIHIGGKMFEIASQLEIEVDIEGQDVKKLQDMASQITSFDMIVGEEMTSPKGEFKKAVNAVRNSHEELMRVNNKDGAFLLKIDEHKGTIREVVGIGHGQDEFLVFSLMGSIELEELGSVINNLNEHALHQIEASLEGNVTKFKVYPNPVAASAELNIEVPEKLQGGEVQILDLNGKVVKALSANDANLTAKGLNPGNYVVRIIKGETQMTKKIIVLQ